MFKGSVSLITTVYNEGSNIRTFLESYKSQTVHADEFIIVDGGSTDNTAEIISEFAVSNPVCNIRLIIDHQCNKKHQISPVAAGRNVAITHASSKIIAVTDAGCLLCENWLEKITGPFQDESVDVVAGYYTVINRNDFENKYGYIFIPENDDFAPSSRSVAFKRRCWEEIGGYPVTSLTAEDTLLVLYFRKKGYKFFYQPEAIVKWIFAKDLNDLKRKLVAYGYGEGFNRIYFIHFLYRISAVFFPLLLLIKKLHSKKRIPLDVMWMFYKNHSFGYIKGLREGITKHGTTKNI